MRNLMNFVDGLNSWKLMFGTPEITYPLTQADCNTIAQELDIRLSPEHLHMDGERSPAEAQKLYKQYSKVYEELNAYCNLNRLNTPAVYEL